MGDCEWDVFGIVDSKRYGDVMGSLWQIGAIGVSNLEMIDVPSHTKYARTLGDCYLDWGLVAVSDSR